MKNILFLILVATSCLLSYAESFSFTYQGQTLWYKEIGNSKTCKVYAYKSHPIQGDLIIPPYATYNNVEYKVVEIGYRAFANYGTEVTSVHLPYTITKIDEEAFQSTDLASINIPNSVTEIGKNAFDLSKLKSIEIPASVRSIGDFALGSSFLNTIRFEDGDESLTLGTDIFDRPGTGVPLKSVYLGRNLVVEKSPFQSIRTIREVVIGEKVNAIIDHAFDGCISLESVTIQKYLKSIGSCAFRNCESLENIILPAVKSINRNAFENCLSLKAIDLLSTLVSIDSEAFKGCESLESIAFPNTLTSIGYHAFDGCSSLTSVIIPPLVKTVDEGAFINCNNIIKYAYPNNLRLSKPTYFSSGFGVAYPSVNVSFENDFIYEKNKKVLYYVPYDLEGIFEIPNTVEEIGELAFSNCRNLSSVIIPESVTSIGSSAFQSCEIMASILIPNSINTIGEGAFINCKGLQSVSLPNSIKKIPRMAFYMCDNLKDLTIGNSVELIDAQAFRDCVNLDNVFIPNSVRIIEGAAFYNCNSLRNLTIGNHVESIGRGAFRDCVKLDNLIIPNSVRTIENEAFFNCNYLHDLSIGNQVESIGNEAFFDCELHDITIPPSVKRIGIRAFYNNHSINIDLAYGLESIGEEAFAEYTNLAISKVVYLTVPSSVTYIGKRAFANKCIDILTIGSGIKHLGEEAFTGPNNHLLSINITAVTPPDAFENTFSSYDTLLLVTPGCEATYANSSPCWCKFNTQTSYPPKDKILPLVAADSIEIDHKSINYTPGKKKQLSAKVYPDAATIQTVMWKSSNPEIAVVDANGVVSMLDYDNSEDSKTTISEDTKCIITAFTLYDDSPIAECRILNPVFAKSISLDIEEWSGFPDDKFSIKASVLPENTVDRTIKWTSSNDSVAIVDKNGDVTCIGKGSCVINATTTDGTNLSATCRVSVMPVPVRSIRLDKTSWNGFPGDTFTIHATVSPENADDKTIIWTSSDTNVATVDTEGSVNAKAIGEAIITAKCGALTAECIIKVVESPVTSITIDKTSVNMHVAETVQLTATILPENATNKNVVWDSFNESVATVNDTGLVTAVSAGQCFVTASAGDGSNVSANCVVTVKPVLIESILLDTPGWKGVKGDCFQIIATIAPEDATDKTLIWTSSDESVASVDDTGMVTAVGVGECLITASAADGSGISASCEVSLDPILVESLTISPEEFLGAKGDSFMIIPTILPENADNKRLEYKSGNEGVAEVDSMGSVTVKDNGSAVITVRTTDGSDIEAECVITSVSGIDSLFTDDSSRFDVYDITGIMLRKDADKEDIVSLSNGIYIILKGDKVFKLNLTEK